MKGEWGELEITRGSGKYGFLDFRIPYTDKDGIDRDYFPDVIVRANAAGGEPINLLLEITGMRRDKVDKMWTLRNRWIPAVNAIGEKHGWPRWDVLEIAEEIRDARNDILKKLGAAADTQPLEFPSRRR